MGGRGEGRSVLGLQVWGTLTLTAQRMMGNVCVCVCVCSHSSHTHTHIMCVLKGGAMHCTSK